MPLNRSSLDDLHEDDLSELIVSGAAEGLQLEFKERTYGNTDSDKREILKDVSALANANGGHIVIGIKESNGMAAELVGIQCVDIDAEILRLDQIMRTGIEPRLPHCMVRSLSLKSGARAIVIRVGRSWRLPHRVCAQNSNRFWIRNSGGCHEASMDELRSMFAQSSTALNSARDFRDRRLEQIRRGSGPRPLVGGGRLIVHIIPQAAVLSTESFDVQQLYTHHGAFWPIGSMGNSPRFNFEGMINERGGDANHGYTQIFRNGSIEATKANIVRQADRGAGIPGLSLEQKFFERYAPYVDGLRAIGVEPPLYVMVTLEGVSGAHYYVRNDMFADELVAFDRDVLFLPECMIPEYGSPETYHAAVRPAFDALWNAVGFAKSEFFDATGRWVGPRR